MNTTVKTVLGIAIVAAVLVAGILIGRRSPSDVADTAAPAEAAKQEPLALAVAPAPNRDPYQRSIHIYEFKKAADSGADRGREIFYYKCWFCHNEFADGAPKLAGVFNRGKLLSGRAANEDGIKDEIRNGGAGMAAYKYTLTEVDLNDLVSYLRDGCCWNSDSPPPNPRFTAGRID